MNKFQKIQKWCSFVPCVSTVFIVIVTMLTMKRHHASPKQWLKVVLIFFASMLVASFVSTFLMTGQHMLLTLIVNTLILAIPNLLYVDIQSRCTSQTLEQSKPASKKPILIGGIVLSAVMSAVVLGVFIYSLVTPGYTVEDINGVEDSSLAVITLEEIVSKKEYYSSKKVSYGTDGDDSDITGNLDQYDYDECRYTVALFSGIKIIQATKTDSDTLTLKFSTERQSGNLEIVVIVDGEYYCHVDATGTQSVTLAGVSGKTILVKVAGESAQFKITVDRVFV